MAFLVLLERLRPVPRAVLVLRDVFDFPSDEIADIVGKSEANCRQTAVRAAPRPGPEGTVRSLGQATRGVGAVVFGAVGAGRMERLVDLLAADVVVYTDGGGKGPPPMHGRERVIRLFGHYRPETLGAVERRVVRSMVNRG